VKFPVGFTIAEDVYFHYITFAHTDKIRLMNNSSYHYLKREDSAIGIIKNLITKKLKTLM
jgi:hypothetical protein